MKITKKEIIHELNSLQIGDQIAELDYGRIEKFWQEGKKWFCSIRDDAGASLYEVRKDGLYTREEELYITINEITTQNGR